MEGFVPRHCSCGLSRTEATVHAASVRFGWRLFGSELQVLGRGLAVFLDEDGFPRIGRTKFKDLTCEGACSGLVPHDSIDLPLI